ncbi:PLD nuclease N-terminal domain-containing protein [Dyadobacter sp. CY261]|uniref:PLDc N-terminal domain-containing protein n=1 Tax=Dyadobacter sp. CY261 TaxID=2907203 RepID=UPI001F17335C|nr:PLD nuclease N-terminal domain-containing protein [Dyadobacter sp. CY261]MCF0069876.1 PLD nuclease N-terminal domain-containing protein [Dyadobacter sp. CY261]
MISTVLLFMGLGGMELMFLFILIPLAITIWALIDAIKSDFKKDINKLVWIIVIVCFPYIGGILYYFLGRSQKAGF